MHLHAISWISFPRATALCLHSRARTAGSSLAMARCNDSCSLTPGSSLAAARCSDSCSRTPSSSLVASLFWLVFSHSLVCACIASSHIVWWLFQTPHNSIGTSLPLIKSLLRWFTIGMRIHLIMLCPYNSLSSKKYLHCIYIINSQSDVRTVKSTNECVVIMYIENLCTYSKKYSWICSNH